MIDRTFIMQLLKVNGLSADARDEEVREVLEKAGWSNEECEAGIAEFRNTGEKEEKPEKKKAFHIGTRASSESASSMLGVRVVLDPFSIQDGGHKRAGFIIKYILGYVFIAVLSLLVAGAIGIGFMYVFGVGPFYVPVGYL